MLTWKRKRAVSEEDLRRRVEAEVKGERQQQRTDEVHDEITEIIIRNHLGDMLQRSLQPRPKEGK